MRKGITFIAFVFSLASCYSQTFSNAYEKAYALITEQENTTYEVTYLSLGKSTELDRTSFKMERLGENRYTRMMEVEAYQIDSTTVVIDHENKSILLNEGIQNPVLDELGKRLELIRDLEKTANNQQIDTLSQVIRYSLLFKDQEYKLVSFEVDAASGRFVKMLIEPSSPIENVKEAEEEPVHQFEIRLDNFSNSIQEFSSPLSKYLKLKEGKYSPQENYTNYQFINNYDWR